MNIGRLFDCWSELKLSQGSRNTRGAGAEGAIILARQKSRLLPGVSKGPRPLSTRKQARQKSRLLPGVVERAAAAFDQKTSEAWVDRLH
jgi:hypothetical protein